MIRILLPALMLLASPALAHTGHDHGSGFLAGITHPLFGPDHLLAMLAVGLWAGVVGGRALWAWPMAFVGGMILGGLAGAGGADLPVVEPVILASVVVVGALAATALRLPLVAASAMLALFGLAHGYAHGLEGTGTALYALGFTLATAALHAAGLGMARLGLPLARGLGGAVALGGAVLAVV